METKSIFISLTNKCPAKCEFCNLGERFEKDYPKYLFYSLVLGSLKENNLKEILTTTWKRNEFIKLMSNRTFLKIAEKNLPKNKEAFKMWNLHSCNLCYFLRKSEEFMKSLEFKRRYKTGKLSLKELKNVLLEASNLKIKNLRFTDEGEPFLEYRKLKNLIKFANDKFENIGVSTNAFFVGDLEEAYRLIRPLKQSGLNDIFISWDFHNNHKLHQSFIPEDNVINLIKASKMVGLNIHVISTLPDIPSKDYIERVNLLKKNSGVNLKLRKIGVLSNYVYNHIKKRGKDEISVHFILPNTRVERNFRKDELLTQKSNSDEYMKKLLFRVMSVFRRKNECFLKFPLVTHEGLVVACALNCF